MFSAFFLIPGARLPEPLAEAFFRAAAPEELSALVSFSKGMSAPVEERLAPAPFERSPHLVWLWKVITRRSSLPETAPWAWRCCGGPRQNVQMWSLSPLALTGSGVVAQSSLRLDDRDFFDLTAALSRAAVALDARIQVSENQWFLTRKKDWDAVCAPAASLVGEALGKAPVCGPDAGEILSALSALDRVLRESPEGRRVNEGRRERGEAPVGGFWLHGGGREAPSLPPTTVRAVLSKDPAVLGWGNAAGILRGRLSPSRDAWPEAPEGHLIALLDDLWEPWLRGDLGAWRKALPPLAAARQKLAAAARERGAEDAVTVLFGRGKSVTFSPPRKKRLRDLFVRSGPALPPDAWLSERGSE